MKLSKHLRSSNYLLLFVLLVSILVAIPRVFSDDYSLHIMIMSCFFLMLTAAYNLAWGYTGLFVLCIQTFFAIGAYTSGLLTTKFSIPFLLALLAALVVVAISGFFIGYLTLRFKGSYFVMITLAFNLVVRLIFINQDILGGPIGLGNIPRPEIIIPYVIKIKVSSNMDFCYFAFSMVFLSMFFFYFLVHSKVGRALRSVRENELLAEFMGVNTLKYKLLALVISSIFCGFAGSLYGHYMTHVAPDLFETYYMIPPMTMTIIGGRGTFFGPIVAAVLLTILPEYLRIAKEYREIIFGILMLTLIVFTPERKHLKSILSKIYGIRGRRE